MATEPDIYTPNIDNNGNYIDKIPSFTNVKHGIRCPCGSRKDKIYETYTIFSQHIKTKAHQKWLQNLNLNKANYYIETEELKITVRQQQMIIAKLEKDLTNKSMTIDFLTQQLVLKNTKQTPIENLLDFD